MYILLGVKDAVVVGLMTGSLEDVTIQRSRYEPLCESVGVRVRVEELPNVDTNGNSLGDFPSVSALTKLFDYFD